MVTISDAQAISLRPPTHFCPAPLYVVQNLGFALFAAFFACTQQDTHTSSTVPKVCSPELTDSQPSRFGRETRNG